jgi:glycosyltransferase involved in cell wall biosynthesis
MVITAIIPALNEEISIGSIVLKTKKHVDQVIVIDDGSTDCTAEVARLAGADVIEHSTNMGKGEALRTGFREASKNGTTIIVTIDADGQHNPDEIPKVVKPILSKNAEIVIGSRYLNGNSIPLYRRIGQEILDRATNANSNTGVSDTQSGFRAFAIHTVHNFKFKQNGFSIESEMLTDAANAGLKIKEVDIGVRYDVECSTENPIYHGLKVLISVLQDMEFNKPLYYFTVPGMVLTTVGLYMGLIFLQVFYNGGSLYFGPTLLMILMTLVGLFMSFAGIILHAISRLNEKLLNGRTLNEKVPDEKTLDKK